MDSAAWGEKFISETQSQWKDILKSKMSQSYPEFYFFPPHLLLEIIWFLRNTGMGKKEQWVTVICTQKTFIVKDLLEHILLSSIGYNQNCPFIIHGLWHK